MNRSDIQLLFDYNDWANDRILERAERVTQEQLTAPNDLGWGSLRGALVHLMDAEWAWRILIKDREHAQELNPDSFPHLTAIRAHWEAERLAFREYLGSLTDADLEGTISYDAMGEMRHRILWHCLAHVVNHGTQHRSECAALLTGFGHSPGDLDFTRFLSLR